MNKYSYKDFTNQKFTDANDFTGIIEGSCFYQESKEGETPPFNVFPADMTGVTFKNCNLDNCIIPDGNTVEGGCNRVLKVQNDWEDWILDEDKKPVEPVNKKLRIKKGGLIDPKDIPLKATKEEKIKKCDWDKTYGAGKYPNGSWFKEIPVIDDEEVSGSRQVTEKSVWDAQKAKGNTFPFDSAPEEGNIEVVEKKIYERSDSGRMVVDENLRPVVIGKENVEVVELKGQVTTYTISGEAHLTR